MAKGRKTGGGSRKGTPNKITASLKEMILKALSDAGGVEYLRGVAKKNPGAFLTLLGKVLPTTLTGADGNPEPMMFEVRFVDPTGKDITEETERNRAGRPGTPEKPPAPERPQPPPLLN